MTNILFFESAKGAYSRVSASFSLFVNIELLLWIAIVFTLLIHVSSSRSKKHKSSEGKQLEKQQELFPSIKSTFVCQEPSESPLVDAFPQPCSTGLTTRLLPFKNSKGEIEWVFTDDVQPGKELDVFEANPGTFKAKSSVPKGVKIDKNSEILSPVTSNSSNNDSISDKKAENSVSPQINTPSSTSSEDQKEEMEDGEAETAGEGENGSFEHECPHCDAKFRMRGYLTRHLKKHMPQKAYQCPFREKSLYKDENDNMHQCHPSGGFSRRDTYKTHLKTRHFKFPSGTPIKGRNQSPGNCAMCGEWFQNAEIWSEIHVEGAECKFLPAGFQGKSRIKNKLKKQMARLMREEKKSKSRSKKSSTFDYLSPGMSTPNVAITPLMSNPSQYEFEDSPTQSSCSSMGPQRSIPTFHDPFQRDIPHRSLYANSPLSDQNIVMTPITHADDYDDEFCLDTEQMSAIVVQPTLSPQDYHNGNFFRVPEYAVLNSDPIGNTYNHFIR